MRQTDYTPEAIARFVAEQNWTAYVQLDVPNPGSAPLATDEELAEYEDLANLAARESE